MNREISMINLDLDRDYYFLRENEVCAKTALKIIGKAYNQDTRYRIQDTGKDLMREKKHE